MENLGRRKESRIGSWKVLPETLTPPPGSLPFNLCSCICPVPIFKPQVMLHLCHLLLQAQKRLSNAQKLGKLVVKLLVVWNWPQREYFYTTEIGSLYKSGLFCTFSWELASQYTTRHWFYGGLASLQHAPQHPSWDCVPQPCLSF